MAKPYVVQFTKYFYFAHQRKQNSFLLCRLCVCVLSAHGRQRQRRRRRPTILNNILWTRYILNVKFFSEQMRNSRRKQQQLYTIRMKRVASRYSSGYMPHIEGLLQSEFDVILLDLTARWVCCAMYGIYIIKYFKR